MEQIKSPFFFTKYCACREILNSRNSYWKILHLVVQLSPKISRNATPGTKKFTIYFYQILRLLRKINFVINPCNIFFCCFSFVLFFLSVFFLLLRFVVLPFFFPVFFSLCSFFFVNVLFFYEIACVVQETGQSWLSTCIAESRFDPRTFGL